MIAKFAAEFLSAKNLRKKIRPAKVASCASAVFLSSREIQTSAVFFLYNIRNFIDFRLEVETEVILFES